MLKNLISFCLIIFFSSCLCAEYQMERIICTTKKTSNCGAYIYNTKTGKVYFCDSEECKEVETPIEIFFEEEEVEESQKGSLIPKKPKKESKIPKMPKKEK